MNKIKIKNDLRKISANQLVSGSFVLLIGNGLVNFGNYLYHLLMGRMLGPVDYGILASLISFTYLLGIPTTVLNLVVVKYVSAFKGRKQWGKIATFYSWLNQKISFFSLPAFILLILVTPLVISFLHLDNNWYFYIVVVSTLIGVYHIINISFLQGFLRFGLISLVGIFQVIFKVGIAVVLVLTGGKVLGAVLAYPAGGLIGLLFSSFFVWGLLKRGRGKDFTINGREMAGYSVPVFFSTLAFASLYTTDIVLARHFLPAQEAGFYAALATLGKIIFFASSPIIMVMFPMVSEKHANGQKYGSLLYLSFGLVLLASLGVSLVYFAFPELMISLLYGQEYLSASSFLWLFAIFISFYSLSSLLINFYLSIKKVKVVVLPVLAAFLQVILVSLFHQDIRQTVLMSIIALSLLLFSLLMYNLFLEKSQRRILK